MKKAPKKKKNGRVSVTYDNGELKMKGSYRDGKMHGEWLFFRRDGTLMRSGEFADGEQVGEWRTYDRDGFVVKATRLGRKKTL